MAGDMAAPRGLSSRKRTAVERLSEMTSPESVQQRRPSKALVAPSRNRGEATSTVEKLQILVDWGRCETDANGWKHGVRDMMSERWGERVAPDYADRLVRKIKNAEPDGASPLEREERADKGVPRLLTPRKQARMHELSDQWNGEWSDADMAAALNAEFGTTITPKGINYHTNWVLPGDWDLKANVRAEPLLLKDQRRSKRHYRRRLRTRTCLQKSASGALCRKGSHGASNFVY